MVGYRVDTSDELYHHGIKGQRWGIRRYQDKNGNLTTKGRARLHKDYDKYVKRSKRAMWLTDEDRKSYAGDKTASDFNNFLTDRYNREYDKKLGDKAKDHDYLNDEEYNMGYYKAYEDHYTKVYNDMLLKDLKQNRSYQKAKQLCDMYQNENLGDYTKTNEASIKEATDYIDWWSNTSY